MATATRPTTDDARRSIGNASTISSPRPKTRGAPDTVKETLCRNVTIYGHCRYENKGCAFIHDPTKVNNSGDNMKKRFNVDSPSFTPSGQNGTSGGVLLSVNGNTKPAGLSPKAASAAPFKPKGLVSNAGIGQENNAFGYGKKSYNPNAPDWSMAPSAADMADYLPQAHNLQQNLDQEICLGLEASRMDDQTSSSTPRKIPRSRTSKNWAKGDPSRTSRKNWRTSQKSPPGHVDGDVEEPTSKGKTQETQDLVPEDAEQSLGDGHNHGTSIGHLARRSSRSCPDHFVSTTINNTEEECLSCGQIDGEEKHQDSTTMIDIKNLKGKQRVSSAEIVSPSIAGNVLEESTSTRSFVGEPQERRRLVAKSWAEAPEFVSQQAQTLSPFVSPKRQRNLGRRLIKARSQYFTIADIARMQGHHPNFPTFPTGSAFVKDSAHVRGSSLQLEMSPSPTVEAPLMATSGSTRANHSSLSPTSLCYVDFVDSPQSYDSQAYNFSQTDINDLQPGIYDSYGSAASSLNSHSQPPISQQNPYAQDPTTNSNNTYYQGTQFSQPLQHHLYAHWGTVPEELLPYQRAAHDFFIPDSLRRDLQDKSAATLQVLPNSTLPTVDGYSNLVPLDTSNNGSATTLGTPTWIYKATWSDRSHQRGDGRTYALRRLAAFKLHDARAAITIKDRWKTVDNSNVVRLSNIFTTKEFQDSSVVIVSEYWPLSKTLAETHFASREGRYSGRHQPQHIPEQVLWSYIVQITNALRAIHNASLAARVIDPTKILVTSKNHIRLNGCGILDIVELSHKQPRSMQDLQRLDLVLFGRLILGLGTNTPNSAANLPRAQEQFARIYSQHLTERVSWLVNQGTTPSNESIEHFAVTIAAQAFNAFDAERKVNDADQAILSRELENSRIARLMMKLNFILERPEYENDRRWAETGERVCIRLFRDYVFHQITPQGAPVLSLAHVISCLNKLDVGIEEMITLTTRDDEYCVTVSYREMKRAIEGAYMDLVKGGRSR